jgi:hypothetical protein
LLPWQLQQSLSNRFRFFWAYLVPLDVDIVPIKFHQFLFGKEPAMIILAAFGVDKIQNGSHCHGNQGAIFLKFSPNFTKFCSNVSCHIHI